VKSFPTITNTIFWDESASTKPRIWVGRENSPSTLTISYSDVKGGQASVFVEAGCSLVWGPGMIDSDPLFLDPGSGDFHLTFNSPCRGSGDNAAPGLPDCDFEGDPRTVQGTVDMGADEFYTHLYSTGNAIPGGEVQVKLVGWPGTTPLALFIGTGVLDLPIPTAWGEWWNDWWLEFPITGPIDLGAVPSPDGVYILTQTLPPDTPGPYSVPIQAFVGSSLTNLCVLDVD
jgi:hypothetical protein